MADQQSQHVVYVRQDDSQSQTHHSPLVRQTVLGSNGQSSQPSLPGPSNRKNSNTSETSEVPKFVSTVDSIMQSIFSACAKVPVESENTISTTEKTGQPNSYLDTEFCDHNCDTISSWCGTGPYLNSEDSNVTAVEMNARIPHSAPYINPLTKARELKNSRRYSNALREYTMAANITPPGTTAAEIQVEMAEVLVDCGLYKKALHAIDIAAMFDPKNAAEYAAKRVVILQRMGDYKNSLVEAEVALQAHPTHVPLLFQAAMVCEKDPNLFNQAKTYAYRILAIEPDHRESKILVARLLEFQGKEGEALKLLKEANAVTASHPVREAIELLERRSSSFSSSLSSSSISSSTLIKKSSQQYQR